MYLVPLHQRQLFLLTSALSVGESFKFLIFFGRDFVFVFAAIIIFKAPFLGCTGMRVAHSSWDLAPWKRLLKCQLTQSLHDSTPTRATFSHGQIRQAHVGNNSCRWCERAWYEEPPNEMVNFQESSMYDSQERGRPRTL